MKITVEIAEDELKEIRRLTGEKKKGPAIRKMVVDALMMRRRQEVIEKVMSGELSAELEGFEESRKSDRAKSARLARALRSR